MKENCRTSRREEGVLLPMTRDARWMYHACRATPTTPPAFCRGSVVHFSHVHLASPMEPDLPMDSRPLRQPKCAALTLTTVAARGQRGNAS
jgi:hypothetical protein